MTNPNSMTDFFKRLKRALTQDNLLNKGIGPKELPTYDIRIGAEEEPIKPTKDPDSPKIYEILPDYLTETIKGYDISGFSRKLPYDSDFFYKDEPKEKRTFKEKYIASIKSAQDGQFRYVITPELSEQILKGLRLSPQQPSSDAFLQQPDPDESRKFVYSFEEGSVDLIDILGGKGANLAEMVRLELPVPPGFTVTTEAFHKYRRDGINSPSLKRQIDEALDELEEKTGKRLGSSQNPLLVSVRSGAKVSMPGMMESVLNIGMNQEVIEALLSMTNDRSFVRDTYKKFVTMYCGTVLGMDISNGYLSTVLNNLLSSKYFTCDSVDKLLISEMKRTRPSSICYGIPKDPREQIYAAIEAVFLSWNLPKAREYRTIHDISEELGTAANVQSMVFGNLDDSSLTGVCFSRDTDSGENVLSGEVLYRAQGEDIVSGAVTPINIADLRRRDPRTHAQLTELVARLEQHYKEVEDVEFTKEGPKLYLLQTRKAKRTPLANIVINLDMAKEGLIDDSEAIKRISAEDINAILNHSIIDPHDKYTVLGKGETSSGIVSGKVALTSAQAVDYQAQGYKAILVKRSTDTEDILGIKAAEGVLTERGGQTSHAAVVARGMGKTCIPGCKTLKINDDDSGCVFAAEDGKTVSVKEGEYITLDGSTGEVINGAVKTIKPENNPVLPRLEQLVQPYLNSKKIADVSSVSDIDKGIGYGAELGIFMAASWFLAGDNLARVQDFILSQSSKREQLDPVMLNLAERYGSIFAAADGKVYCSLLEQGLDLFIPDTKTINCYYGMLSALSASGSLITTEVTKEQTEWVLYAQKLINGNISYRDKEYLEKGILEAQLYAIVTAAKQANSSPVINIPSQLITRYRTRYGLDITEFVNAVVNEAKAKLCYDADIEVATEVEKDYFVFRPASYIRDAFAYLKASEGNLK